MRAARVKADLKFDLKTSMGKNPLLKWALGLVIEKVLEIVLKYLKDQGLTRE